MAYNKIKHIKSYAKDWARVQGITVKEFTAEDIEYIGGECQCNYADVCDILGIKLPASLGPVSA